MFSLPAYAQGAGDAGGGTTIFWVLQFGLIFVIFYFFMIRPQKKRMQTHKAMIEAVKRGDTVVTSGGIVGKVTRVQDEEVQVQIADGVRIQVVKSTLSDVRVKGAS